MLQAEAHLVIGMSYGTINHAVLYADSNKGIVIGVDDRGHLLLPIVEAISASMYPH
jgi:hypothetical protein